jgi:hypothetical protein
MYFDAHALDGHDSGGRIGQRPGIAIPGRGESCDLRCSNRFSALPVR